MAVTKAEFYFKNNIYVLPKNSTAYLVGKNIRLYENGKKTNLGKYETIPTLQVGYPLNTPITVNTKEIEHEYRLFGNFMKGRNLNLVNFDYETSHNLSLCSFFSSEEQKRADQLFLEIQKCLPHLINIFKKPVIHIKERSVVQPVDMVSRINHKTVHYLTVHTEDWAEIKDGTVVPKNLHTRVGDDDYGIYENLVFCNLIKKIQSFLRHRIRFLSDIAQTFDNSVKLDDFTKYNHQMYYLAVGKLYLGFYKTGQDSALILDMLEQAKKMYKTINRYTHRQVFKINKNKPPLVGDIKQTNILTMHKDYKHVYNLDKKFRTRQLDSNVFATSTEAKHSCQNYNAFCQLLTLFATVNFNFVADNPTAEVIQNGKINATMHFAEWTINIKSKKNVYLQQDCLEFTVSTEKKSKKYLLIPFVNYIDGEKQKMCELITKKLVLQKNKYDKYVFLDPFSYNTNSFNYDLTTKLNDNTIHYSILPITLSEINSFRRIQKLIFECMVQTGSNTVCAFCGEKLSHTNKHQHVCLKCRTMVQEIQCTCGENVVATTIELKHKPDDTNSFFTQELTYMYRNATNMAKYPLCPHCNTEITKEVQQQAPLVDKQKNAFIKIEKPQPVRLQKEKQTPKQVEVSSVVSMEKIKPVVDNTKIQTDTKKQQEITLLKKQVVTEKQKLTKAQQTTATSEKVEIQTSKVANNIDIAIDTVQQKQLEKLKQVALLKKQIAAEKQRLAKLNQSQRIKKQNTNEQKEAVEYLMNLQLHMNDEK